MEEEQEGINLETNNPNIDEIGLPDVEETDDTEVDKVESQVQVNDNIDEDKEKLKNGVNLERKKRKEAEKKARELQKQLEALKEADRTPTKTTVEELIEKGVDESIAQSIADAIDRNKHDDSATKKELANMQFKLDITEKSKENGFEDILDYVDEIKALVDKGLSIEQSYYATTYSKPSSNTKSEIERKVEAKIQNQVARKEILGGNLNSNNGVSATKPKINATAEEKAIAVAAGMSVEEYIAIRDMASVKEYTSYKSKKK